MASSPGNFITRLTIAGLEVPARKFGEHPIPRPLGVHAPEFIWCLPPDTAASVLALQETEISVTYAGSTTPKVFKRIKVVKEAPTDSPLKRYVVLSDTRWYLPRTYVKAIYNLRTESSQTELLQVDGTPLEVDPVASVVTFSANSIKSGKTPWQAKEILDDVLQNRLSVKYTYLARNFGNYIPNDVMLDGPGNIALMQALAAVGGLDVRVNDDGNLELVDAQLGAERATIEKYVPYSLRVRGSDRGAMRWVSMGNVAPTKVSNGFDAEMEVRGDAWVQAPGVQVGNQNGQWPTFDMVIRVTDKQLATTDPVTGKSYQAVVGSFLPVDQWFSAVAADTTVPAPPNLPAQVSWSRQYALLDYFAKQMEKFYATGVFGGLEPSAVWINRYGSLVENFFKTWRLNPAFASLCLAGSIRPVRAQLLDAANQTRQPSTVYQDYCRRPSTRGLRDDPQGGWNVHSIPGTPTTQQVGATKTYNDPSWPSQVVPLSQCTVAPVTPGLLDPIAGIFQFKLRKDVFDHSAELAPALVQQLPTVDLDQVNRGAAIAYWEQAQLIQTHRMILVFTAVPAAAPLYFVDVQPSDALKKLGADSNAVKPQGTPFQTRTGPALQTARFAYSDSQRGQIQSIFAATVPATAQATLQSMTPVNQAILQDYATSVAAVLYAAMLDHYEGTCDVAFTPDAMPQGSLQSVTHIATADGKLYTRFEAKHVIPPIQPIHLMERGARAVVFRTPGNFQ